MCCMRWMAPTYPSCRPTRARCCDCQEERLSPRLHALAPRPGLAVCCMPVGETKTASQPIGCRCSTRHRSPEGDLRHLCSNADAAKAIAPSPRHSGARWPIDRSPPQRTRHDASLSSPCPNTMSPTRTVGGARHRHLVDGALRGVPCRLPPQQCEGPPERREGGAAGWWTCYCCWRHQRGPYRLRARGCAPARCPCCSWAGPAAPQTGVDHHQWRGVGSPHGVATKTSVKTRPTPLACQGEAARRWAPQRGVGGTV